MHRGGRQVARQLVVSGEFQYGIRRLAKLRRLDLSLEHIMQEAQFTPLFTEEELVAARWRLERMASEG
jgi:predicted nucleic acid-binding protein